MNIERNEAQEYGGNGEHATLYASSNSIAAEVSAGFYKEMAQNQAISRVHDLPSFKREEKPLNTGHSHACSNPELGEFITHITFNAAPAGEPADWQVRFNYMRGHVIMRVEQNNYKYVTTMYR